MEKDRILSDREKLELWEHICVQKGWAATNEIDRWLRKHSIYFTGGGSCVNVGSYLFRIENVDNAKVIVNGSDIDEFVTFIIESLCGILTFIDVEVEGAFWKLARQRLNEEFDQELPRELVPKYLRDLVYENKKDDPGADPDFTNPHTE